jgi:hypothetical protein
MDPAKDVLAILQPEEIPEIPMPVMEEGANLPGFVSAQVETILNTIYSDHPHRKTEGTSMDEWKAMSPGNATGTKLPTSRQPTIMFPKEWWASDL